MFRVESRILANSFVRKIGRSSDDRAQGRAYTAGQLSKMRTRLNERISSITPWAPTASHRTPVNEAHPGAVFTVTTSSHFQPSYLFPVCRRCVYRFRLDQERWPETAATWGTLWPISNSLETPSWRRSWKCRSTMPSSWHARVNPMPIASVV